MAAHPHPHRHDEEGVVGGGRGKGLMGRGVKRMLISDGVMSQVKNCAGFATGFSGVQVGVQNFAPQRNLYPWHGYVGWRWVDGR